MTNKNKKKYILWLFYGIYQIEICLDKNLSFFCLSSFCDLSVVYIWATPNKVTPNEIQFEANENYFQIYVCYEKQKFLKGGINK